jgi:hypothetical protein
MATLAAIRDGRRDAKLGRGPYFAKIVMQADERVGRFREGLNATARIIFLGIVVDTIYQEVEFKEFYPNEAVIVALMLAFIPYLIARGLVTRIALSRQRRDGKA